MGKYDTCMQEYLQNKQYFADLFNGCFFHGKPVICASELTEASEGYVVDQDNTITSEKTLAAVKVRNVFSAPGIGLSIRQPFLMPQEQKFRLRRADPGR